MSEAKQNLLEVQAKIGVLVRKGLNLQNEYTQAQKNLEGQFLNLLNPINAEIKELEEKEAQLQEVESEKPEKVKEAKA